MLKFKVDENLPIEVATLLVDAGHDALTVLDQNLGSGGGESLLAHAESGAVGGQALDRG